MAGAAAGVEGLQIGQLLRPGVKGSGSRCPGAILLPHKAQVFQWNTPGIDSFPAQFLFAVGVPEVGFGEPSCRPPSSQGVVEQEADHVGLGEELGYGWQLPRADLDLGCVDLVLLLGLPELIDPAEAVGGGEYVQWQVAHQALQFLLATPAAGPVGRPGESSRKIWGSMRVAKRAASSQPLAAPSSAARSSHSSRVTATGSSGSGYINRWFSARKRAKSMRCQCS